MSMHRRLDFDQNRRARREVTQRSNVLTPRNRRNDLGIIQQAGGYFVARAPRIKDDDIFVPTVLTDRRHLLGYPDGKNVDS